MDGARLEKTTKFPFKGQNFSLFNKGRWLALSFREGIFFTISLAVMPIKDSVEVVSTNDESQAHCRILVQPFKTLLMAEI